MKYGAPEEIRTPDPQIRSLATETAYPRKINILPIRVCFLAAGKLRNPASAPAFRKHTPSVLETAPLSREINAVGIASYQDIAGMNAKRDNCEVSG